MNAVPDLPKKDGKDFRNHRAKLWELELELHCSVIGTCASIRTLRKIHERINKTSSGQYSDYQIHNLFVKSADYPRAGIKLLQKHLEKTHAVQIGKSRGLQTEEELHTFWRGCVDEGTIAGGYWALMTHPRITQSLYMRAFGEVHMLSHIAGRQWQADSVRRYALQLELKESKARLNEKQRDLAKRQKVGNKSDQLITKLETRVSVQSNEIEALKENITLLESADRVTDAEQRIKDLLQQVNQTEVSHAAEIDELRRNHVTAANQAEQTVAQYQRDAALLEQRLQAVLSDRNKHREQSCDDLCGRCILYVGGQTGAQPNFRQLVEDMNGKFLYHDGGREDSRTSLAGLINQADAVLCPASCVSHAAMFKIKQVCARHSKKMIWLRSSSLTAFNTALGEVHVN